MKTYSPVLSGYRELVVLAIRRSLIAVMKGKIWGKQRDYYSLLTCGVHAAACKSEWLIIEYHSGYVYL